MKSSPQHFLLVVNCRSCGRELPAGIVSGGARLNDIACRAICSTCSRSYLLLARNLRRVPIEKPN